MDQQNQYSQTPISPPQEPKQSSFKFILEYWKFVIGFLFIMGLALGAYYAWQKYYSPEAKSDQAEQQKWEKAQKAINALEKTLRQDTYGGKTPEETLKMFIDALKKDDIELASKYFMLNTNANSPDYLTRREWKEALQKTKEAGKLQEAADIASKTVLDPQKSSDNTSWFVLENKNGIVEYSIILILNKYSGVWKIENL
jgi:hypothetical protein